MTSAMSAPSVTVEAKVLGQRRPLFSDWQIELPPGAVADEDAGGLTLAALIERVVHEEVRAFRERREVRRLTRALSREQIDAAVRAGKVDMGGARTDDPAQEATAADVEAAVATALQAFRDGVYYVFVDDAQVEDLAQPLRLSAGSRVTFLRLVPLAGG